MFAGSPADPSCASRVGDWRVLFERKGITRTLGILRVLSRGRAYRD